MPNCNIPCRFYKQILRSGLHYSALVGVGCQCKVKLGVSAPAVCSKMANAHRLSGCVGGHGLLVLLPSEQAGMVEALKAANVPVKSTRLNPTSLQSAASAMQALLSKHSELKVCPWSNLESTHM